MMVMKHESQYRLATCLLWLACALATGVASAAPHPSVARIIVQERGAVAYGSGSLIDLRDDYGLVITNWHVVRDATGKIEVLFPSGFRSEARAIKLDEDWDLAALVVWRPPAKPIAISPSPPRPGDPLTICGYGQGDYREATGRCTEFYAPSIGLPHELVELSVEARQGDSGGPILNARGELAGVLFGAGKGTTLGSFAPRVGTFLASLAPDIGRQPGPAGLPSTPPLIAHAPPSGGAPPVVGSSDSNWQRMTGPQTLASPSDEAVVCDGESTPWPEAEVASSSEFDDMLADAHPGDVFKPWTSAKAQVEEGQPDQPAVVAIPGVVGAGEMSSPPEWFDTTRNVLAVLGVVFLFLQLVRLMS